MANRISVGGLKVDEVLYRLVRNEIAPGTGVDADAFWASLGKIVKELGPKNRRLLEERKSLEKQIDAWCLSHRGQPIDTDEYKTFLKDIRYLIPEGKELQVSTANVDREIAAVSGPQLVVPLDNARYALNAANARWGSLYDALYGTNVIPEDGGAEKTAGYNPARGAKVIAATEAFLDETVGLERGKFSDVRRFSLKDKDGGKDLVAILSDGSEVCLADRGKFAGFNTRGSELTSILLRNNNLHIEIQIDREHAIGKAHPAGVKDVCLEAAVTTIQDCEDSVAAVDASDKATIYRNWTGIMKGTLEAKFERYGRPVTRRLNPDKIFTAPGGENLTLPGRSLLLVRNVGIHMYTDAVTTADDEEIPEGFLDCMVTSLAALHDLKRTGDHVNSRTGGIYIVKPKLTGRKRWRRRSSFSSGWKTPSAWSETLSRSGSWTKSAAPRSI
jgi:malate synthase